MNLGHPAFDILGENDARVLHQLAVLGDGASGRRIQELAGVANLRTVQRILERLERVGLIDVQPIGRANRYSLNRAHILWDPIERLLEAPARAEEEFQMLIGKAFGPAIDHAILYGSFARGTANLDSDIDVLIVWADDVPSSARLSTVSNATDQVERLTGNRAQFLSVTADELAALIEANDPLIESIRSNGRALTTGTDVRQVLRGSQ